MKPPDQVVYYFLNELTRQQSYVSFSERFLEEERDKYLGSLGHAAGSTTSARYEHRRDLAADFIETFPQYYRSASLLVLFSAFEENLNHLCLSLQEHRHLSLAPSDLSDRGIDRSRSYLARVASWKLPEDSDWQKIKEVQEIRNLFAHASGYISNEKLANIEAIVARTPDFILIHRHARNRLSIETGYLEHFLLVVKSYMNRLIRRNPVS
jgi:hypothetical protein